MMCSIICGHIAPKSQRKGSRAMQRNTWSWTSSSGPEPIPDHEGYRILVTIPLSSNCTASRAKRLRQYIHSCASKLGFA